MSESPPGGASGSHEDPADRPLPQALVRKSRPISLVWLIPIVAALTGGFLAWKAISEQGPRITILFDEAEGITAEKTKIKYKDVEIGVVESVGFTDDFSKVEVTASLDKGAEPYLTDKTRFWVVRAQVSAGQVTGLGTLLGGSCIGVDISNEGESRRAFVGLEKAPIVTSEDEGGFYTLRAESLGSLGVGAPVYYRSLHVGQVVAYEMDESGKSFTLQVFVRSPHDRRITTATRFWNASGFDAVFNAEGLRIDTPSVVSMLIGGIAFENFERLSPGQAVADQTVFTLYETRQASLSPRYTHKVRYLVHFDRSVGGLAAGSPVEFRGIRLGEVVDVRLTYDFDSAKLPIPVVIEIEPGRIEPTGHLPDRDPTRGIDLLVAKGLRARLSMGNLLTGQLEVELDFIEHAVPAEMLYGGIHPEIPTAPDTLDQLTNSLASTMSKIDAIPLDAIGRKVDRLLAELEGVTAQLNRDLAPALAQSLESLEQTLGSVEQVVGPDSAILIELRDLLRDLGDTARSTRLLTERLSQYPEDLLRGRNR